MPSACTTRPSKCRARTTTTRRASCLRNSSRTKRNTSTGSRPSSTRSRKWATNGTCRTRPKAQTNKVGGGLKASAYLDGTGFDSDIDVAADGVRDRAALLGAGRELAQLGLVDPLEAFDRRLQVRRDDFDAGVALVGGDGGRDAHLACLAALLADRVGQHHRIAHGMRGGEQLLGGRLTVAFGRNAAGKGHRLAERAGAGLGSAAAFHQGSRPIHIDVPRERCHLYAPFENLRIWGLSI